MKKLLIILSLFFLGKTSFSQNRHFVYVDVLPILSKTVDVGYEYHILPYLSTSASIGYAFNSRRGNILKKGDAYDLSKQTGMYLKTQIQFNIRKKLSQFAPILGVNIINALAIEEGTYTDLNMFIDPITIPVKKESYNLAINAVFGITSPSNKRFSFSLGLQAGSFLINNTLSFHSHIPGTGIRTGGITFQGFAKVKFRIIPFEI